MKVAGYVVGEIHIISVDLRRAAAEERDKWLTNYRFSLLDVRYDVEKKEDHTPVINVYKIQNKKTINVPICM